MREVDVEYFTDANLAVSLKVLEVDQVQQKPSYRIEYGDVTVNAMATIFKKIRLSTFETIGSGPIHLPEQELHTSAVWVNISEQIQESFEKDELETALCGVSHTLQAIACLYVMCDANDLRAVAQIKAIHSGEPTIFLYDRYPGGVGLSEEVFKGMDQIFEKSYSLIKKLSLYRGLPILCWRLWDREHQRISYEITESTKG